MGGAIAKALSKTANKIYVSDKNVAKLAALKKSGRIFVERDFKNLNTADVVIVAVKPQDVKDLSFGVKLPSSTILMSIAAGLPISKLAKWFNHRKIVRVMPNLGLTVGAGVAVWKSVGLSAAEKQKAARLLDSFTDNFEVSSENKIDAATAISGSGPAYFFYLANSLQQSAKSFGFSDKQARLLVEKTFAGAAMLQIHHDYPNLIARVRSKKGTTDAALKVFQKKKLDKIIALAAKAAYNRAKELSNA